MKCQDQHPKNRRLRLKNKEQRRLRSKYHLRQGLLMMLLKQLLGLPKVNQNQIQ